MIPSGTGWAHHSLTNDCDIGTTAVGIVADARFAPLETTVGTPPGESIASDPVGAPPRKCYFSGLLDASNEEQTYQFPFQHTAIAADAQLNERPSELWMEFEVYADWTRISTFGGDQWWFFSLLDASSREMKFIHHGAVAGGNTSVGNGPTTIGIPATKSTNSAWATKAWRTVRIRYRKATTPGSATAGSLMQWYAAAGSVGNGNTLTFSDQLSGVGDVAHFGDVLRAIQVKCRNINAYTTIAITNGTWVEATKTLTHETPGSFSAVIDGEQFQATGGANVTAGFYIIASHTADTITLTTSIGALATTGVTGTVMSRCGIYFRNLCWGTSDPALGDGINTPNLGMSGSGADSLQTWFRQCGGLCPPHLGNQTADGSTVKCKVGGRYDGNQFEVGTSIEAVVQWSTDPAFASLDETNSATTTVTERWCWSKTVAGLPQNSTVYFRIKYIVDGLNEYLTSISTLKTVSATTPGTIVINWGSCNRSHGASGVQGPASAYDAMAQPHFHVDLGDKFYADSNATGDGIYWGGGAGTPADYIASNGGTRSGRQTAIEKISVRNIYGHSQAEKMRRRAATIDCRSDHDAGRDGFDGAGATYGGAAANADGQLLAQEFAEVARDMYLSHNQFSWDKNIRLTFTGGTYSHANKRITKAAGTFDNVVVGDRYECTVGTNATLGYYTIAAKTTSTIDLTISLGAAADGSADIAGTICPTVFYGQSDTARCSFFWLDTRTHFNKAGSTVLGITQNTDLVNAIAATTKPNVFLFADGPWHTTNAEATDNFGGYTGERNPIFDEIQANPYIVSAYLMCADRHYCIINRANFTTWPKIRGCFMSSPFNNTTIDPATDSTGVDVIQYRAGKSGNQVARIYMQATISEGTGQVAVSVVNGETGLSVFDLSFGGGAAAMRLISGPLADDDEER